MKKGIKIISGAVIVLIPIVGLSYIAPCLITYDGDSKQGRALSDIRQIGHAIKKLNSEGTLTVEVLSKINSIGELAPLLVPQLEQGAAGLLDPWGDPFLLEKRKESGCIIVKVWCNRKLKRRCFEWKEKEMAMEVTVSDQDGQVTRVKHLWMDD